jgi:hypothetical protein
VTCRESVRPAHSLQSGGPQEFDQLGRQINFHDSNKRLRLQYLAARLHELGPKPLFHFLDELEHGADLRESLETYAALPADLIAAYQGDKFMPPAFAIGGRR